MTKKYIGKLKSFDKIIEKLSIDGFYTADYIKVLFENSGTEIELIDGYYKNCLLKKELFSEIKEVEENEVWKPKLKEQYFYLDRNQAIKHTEYYECGFEEYTAEGYNCWKTKEEAETVEKSMKLYRAMKRWSFDNDNGYEFIVGGCNICLCFNASSPKYEVSDFPLWESNNFPLVHFSSREKATQCLEWLKKEKLI